jgi:non-specific protein-tyrosine kinase
MGALGATEDGRAFDQAQAEQVAAVVDSVRKAIDSRDAAGLRAAIAALQGAAGVKPAQGSDQLIRGAALQLLVDELDAVERLARNSAPRIVAPASSEKSPVRPDPLRNGLVAAVLGALLGVGLVLMRSYFDRRVNRADTLRAVTGLPVLAAVADPSDVQELRAALQLRGAGEALAVLQLTSPRREPVLHPLGAQIGAAFARSSRSVIVVDVDSRSHESRTPRLDGFSPSAVADVDALLRAAPTVDGVRIIPAGDTPEDPAAFLGSPGFIEFLGALRTRADLVVVISPPVLEWSDALLVGQVVDATVLVTPAGSSRVADVQAAMERLSSTDRPTLGTVLTGPGKKRTDLFAPLSSPIGGELEARQVNGSSRASVRSDAGHQAQRD